MCTSDLSAGGVHMESLEPRRLMAFSAIGTETTVAGSSGVRSFDLAVAGDGSYLVAMVVGEEDATISAVRYSASGVQIGSALTIDSVAASFMSTVAASIDADGDAVVAYEKPDDVIVFVRISKDGLASAPVEVARNTVADEQLASPAVSMDADGGFFVGWIVDVTDDVPRTDAIRARAYDRDGLPRGTEFTVPVAPSPFSAFNALDIAARPDGSEAVITYGLAGELANSVRYSRINTITSVGGSGGVSGFEQNSPDIAMRANGTFVITYDDFPPSGPRPATRARAMQFTSSGQALERQIQIFPTSLSDEVDDASHSPFLDVLPDGGFLVTFVHTIPQSATAGMSIVYAQRFNADGVADSAGAIELDRQATSDNEAFSITPVVGADDHGTAVVGYLDTASDAVRIRRLTAEFARLDGSDLYVFGTNGDDIIDVYANGTEVEVRRGDELRLFDVSDVTMLSLRGLGGDDSIINRTSFPSTISADDGNDTITGGSGKDKLRGLGGRDFISGGEGNDTIFGDDGVDSLFGNGGRDRINGGANADHIRGNAGRDKLFGGGGNDRLYGGASGDWLFGGAHEDHLLGEGGDDRLYGQDGADTLHGNADNDFFFTNDLRVDRVFGDGGRDLADADNDDELNSIESLL